MAKKKKKENKIIEMHQHIGPDGKIFGKAHPKEAYHKKYSTWEAHNNTIYLEDVV